MKRLLSCLFFICLFSPLIKATHNRAGEITYRQISGFQYEFTITTYTRASSMADRNDLTLNMGNGDSILLPRVNGSGKGVLISADIKKNIYIGKYTYGGAGRYWIWMQDPNRNSSILNIPQSVNVPFYIRTLLVINPLLGTNNSPVLLNPPIDNACVNKCFEHNPGAYDPDGDSLSYKLVPCLADGNTIPGYTFPDPGPGGIRTLDPIKGDFLWCSPQKIGEYNIAILIEEWRNGYLIGSVLRDMQITAAACKNEPPVIKNMNDTCVLAGSLLQIPVTAIDPDKDLVTLIGTGGPFLENPAAQFDTVNGNDTVTSLFKWQTSCAQVQKQPFQVTFKATDNRLNENLVDFETWNITVVGPAPENPSATPSGSGLSLKWDQSLCQQTSCYKIYRHNGFTGWKPGPCETGVPAYTGYTLIETIEGLSNTTYFDNNKGLGLVHGVDYCYMVVACYPDGSESYASKEFCGKLVRDVPIITNVSVMSTGTKDSIYIAWLKPVADAVNLDTTKLSGPYGFRLMQGSGFPGGGTYTEVANFQSPYFKTLKDTEFVSKGLNTRDSAYSYKVEFYANGGLIGSTAPSSSVYLTIEAGDNKLHLKWKEVVSWSNYKYFIYKKEPLGTSFVYHTSTSNTSYTDTGLVNGAEYCYYIRSVGAYSDTTLPAPLLNDSERACSSPVDKVPPCAPVLSVLGDCQQVENRLSWTNPNSSCSDDAILYHIYYTPVKGTAYKWLATISSVTDTNYLHTNISSIAGCYVVTAVDSFANESAYSNEVCIDNCPLYQLPNVFTPDGDGKNDFFIPFPYKFVQDIELKIYNRWGQVMFETNNPDIRWDGKNQETKQLCSSGTYYYTCTVNEIRVTGVEPRTLRGFVQLIQGKSSTSGN